MTDTWQPGGSGQAPPAASDGLLAGSSGTLPALSLPKGGGAIRDIGEKFAVNPVTGTGAMTIPVSVSPGRSGFGPELALSYDSGSGNGPFGFGWSMSLPAVSRKTDKGLPLYHDHAESDVFLLAGAEDLTPALLFDASEWRRDVTPSRNVYGVDYAIHRYRPRVDSLFARIERWVNLADPRDTCWRSITRDNVTTWYGKTAHSRIADPAAPERVFSWLICESYDDKGNVVSYRYKPEDSTGVDLSQACERNRTDTTRSANRYLKRVRYGNRTTYFPDLTAETATPLPTDWCFEVVLDYGDHDCDIPVPQDTGIAWASRADPFSSYRAGFEVRSYRLCRRVLMFHNFPAAADVGAGCLVRSTDLSHAEPGQAADPSQPFYSYLLSVTQSGHRRDGHGRYASDSLPPLKFEYTEAAVDETVIGAGQDTLANLPEGVDGTSYRWVDLNGEGLSGVLTEQAGSWFYKANLSPVNEQTVSGTRRTLPWFAPTELVGRQPSTASLGTGGQLFSVSGDGQLDLVEFSGPAPGYYERTDDANWLPFTAFESLPVLDWRDPQLKFIDLTGDGFPDLLISDGDALRWHPSLATRGFDGEQRVPVARDEESGPKLVFADGTETVFTADMSGDGLTDLVRIRNGEVCYWPNLGYGRFGAKITMDGAPAFDRPDLFDARRIQLADIDGSGTADIAYFASGSVRLYFNQSGNGWGAVRDLTHFPAVDSASHATVMDLLGTGTACLVWSSPLPGNARRQLRYIDLMGGCKPHLLVAETNNLGARSVIRYAPSTKFYVKDKLAGTPWVTRLPFPVHVVERVETYDYISRNVFVTSYAYHHGYYDGVEREFRGFGRVDQRDHDLIATLADAPGMPDPVNLDAASVVPPVLTKTWFHTGAYFGEAAISAYMSGEYYQGDGRAAVLDGTVPPVGVLLPDGTRLTHGFSPQELREACRALRGSVLRQEVYALDDSPAAGHPYSVSERNYTIEALAPQGPNRYAAFFAHPRETIDYHYERRLYWVAGDTMADAGTPGAVRGADPRVSHTLTLSVDPYGNILESASVGYGRRYRDPALTPADQAAQAATLGTLAVNGYANPVDSADTHRTPVPAQNRAYELIHVQPGAAGVFSFAELAVIVAGLADGQHDTPYENAGHAGLAPGQAYRRPVAQARTYYRPDDLGAAAGDPRALLPLGTVESLALPGAAYQLAFTPGLIAQSYQRDGTALLPVPGSVLGSTGDDGGGYVDLDGNGAWWAPGGRLYYTPGPPSSPGELDWARQHFFVPGRLEDPFGHPSSVGYDHDDLLITQTADAVINTASAVNDYRILAPVLITDANGNQAAVSHNVLGLVTATAVMGKPGETLGDSLTGFSPDLTQAEIDAFYNAADPHAHAVAAPLLGDATTRIVYDLHGFARSRAAAPDAPAAWRPPFAATIARETHVSALAGGQSALQVGFGYCDGFGREIQRKSQAEPGPVVAGGPEVNPRWVGSGWTIFNNKGKPVRQYEPFFSQLPAGHQFEFGTRAGVSPILCYDPPGRVVATIHPDHTYEKAVVHPWHLMSWGTDDTVTETDPVTDPDVADFFKRLPPDDYLPAWYTRYSGGTQWERQAAAKAAANAGTPALAYLDSLGRTIIAVADNGPDGRYFSWAAFDIQGNQRSATDPLDRVVVSYEYALTRARISQASMEAGRRWTLPDATGKMIRAWDSRGHNLRTTYDPLRRVTGRHVAGTDPASSDPRTLAGEVRYEQTDYGEGQANDQGLNLRTRVFQHHDCAGVVRSMVTNPATGRQVAYDFKGNPLGSSRTFVRDEASLPDWSQPAPPLLPDDFVALTSYDALNRVTTATAPDGSVTRPVYNEASLLTALTANLRGAATATQFVDKIGYNPRRQREQINYGTDVVSTTYGYDSATFRLTSLTTTRNGFPAAEQTVQDLSYTYEAAGNITHIQDDADIQNVVFFRNRRVEPSADYSYDAIHRLVTATGREHLGLNSRGKPLPPAATSYNDVPRVGLLAPGDGNAMGTYTEQYHYDKAGNFLTFTHQGSDPANRGWSRSYTYSEASLLDPAQVSNRLTSTQVSGNRPLTEPYSYDPHGNVTAMPQLQQMGWDFADQLRLTSRRPVNNADADGKTHQGEQTYYVYNAAGERVRKTTVSAAGDKLHETLYLGGYEVYRRYRAGNLALERHTLHIMDDKQRVALVETVTVNDKVPPSTLPTTAIRYQFGNHLGTACLELDETGEVITYEEYYPYGGTAYQAGRTTVEASRKRYRYTAKERDKETGLYYHGARYYAPWLGRWTSADPSLLGDGVDLYVFCLDSPVRYRDPNGRNAYEDLFKFLRDTGGFSAADMPKGGPPQFTPAHASPFGTAGHQAITNTLDEIKALGKAAFTGIERVYAEVAVQHGTNTVTKIGGSPIPGHHNLDLVAMSHGQSLTVNQTLASGAAEVVGDAKFGGGSITAAHSAFGKQALTVNGTSAATPGASAGAASETEQAFSALTQELATDSTSVTASAPSAGASFDANAARALWKSLQAGRQSALLSSLKNGIGKVLGFFGNAAAVGGAFVAGYQVGTGIDEAMTGKASIGTTDILGGSAQLGIAIGVPAAVKAGAVVGGGASALALVSGLAAASVGWAVEDTKRALEGKRTLTEEAVGYWSKNRVTKTFQDLWWQIKN